MRILIVTDAWRPQVNGVVNTLEHTVRWLQRFGHEVEVLSPERLASVPCPTYPEIRLTVWPMRHVRKRFQAFRPDVLHIATEGPLGFAARRLAVREGRKFTTSYHTQFPQYVRRRAPIPLSLSYAAVRWFHSAADRTMVSTPTMEAELRQYGMSRLARWQRGVDTDLFKPRPKDFIDLPRPLAVYVGRVAVEKSVVAFIAMDCAGGKLVIGDGPELPRLKAKYPGACYTGYLRGEKLAMHLAAADVMVFPSRTDTFGLVNLEAMACGVPVAAHPVTGPIDVIQHGRTGILDEDLARAARMALALDPRHCREQALASSWEASTRQFESNLTVPGADTTRVDVHEPLAEVAAHAASGHLAR
ncbi:MAG: glycosyltransferase family 1 protein [Steroidobacteraceae bacterium]